MHAVAAQPPRNAHPVLQMAWQPDSSDWALASRLPHDSYSVYSRALAAHLSIYPSGGYWRVRVEALHCRRNEWLLPSVAELRLPLLTAYARCTSQVAAEILE